MRFWLILLAMLSGLSLADMAHAASPTEVVGAAQCACVAASPKASQCATRQHVAPARQRPERARIVPPAKAGVAQPFGITIHDRPLE